MKRRKTPDRILPVDLTGDWQGWRIDKAGVLWPGDTWRNGFTVHQLRAMFYESQQARSLQARIRQLESDLGKATADLAASERKAAFYRRQCHLEAKLGMALLPLH